jgi:Protein of unknown function (DUF2459)
MISGRLTVLTAMLGVALAGPCWAAPAGNARSQAEVPAEETTVYITSTPTHSDIIIPRSAFSDASPLMRKVAGDAKGGPWIVLGWGPYWFGREVKGGPYHRQPVLGINAIYTTVIPQLTSRVRVAALDQPGPAPLEQSMGLVAVKMTPDGLQRAIRRIEQTIETTADGAPLLADQGGAAPGVTIYRSQEFYHATHECNHWVSEVLHAGGVRDLPLFDLLPQSLNADLRISGATQVSGDSLGKATAEASRSDRSDAAEHAPRQGSEAGQ